MVATCILLAGPRLAQARRIDDGNPGARRSRHRPAHQIKKSDDVKEALGKINSRDRDAWAWVNPDGGHMAQSKNRPDGKIF